MNLQQGQYRGTVCINFIVSMAVVLWYAVVQLVEALRYNPGGRGFDS